MLLKEKKHIFLLLTLYFLSVLFLGYLFIFKVDINIPVVRGMKENLKFYIMDHYSETVMVTQDADIYRLNNTLYERVAETKKGSVLHVQIYDEKSEYFRLKDTDFYIKYTNVLPYESIATIDEYLVFPETIVTNPTFNIYNESRGDITINEKMEFNIYANLKDTYILKFNDQYFNINKKDVSSSYINSDISEDYANEIPVLNYHFFYDSSNESCNQIICLEKSKFEEQLIYLKDNGFKTLSINEFNRWMNNEIVLPKKSVLITIDDGALGTDTHLIKLLEKYDMKATLFLITAWWNKDKYYSPNLEIQSHGHDIHLEGYCKNVSRGARGLCLSEEELITDFNMSKEAIGDNVFAFVYPYYLYNNNMINALKKTEFNIAFIGGNSSAKQSNNKYLIPRYIIYSNTNIKTFINIVN